MRVRERVWWMCVCVSSCSWVLLAYVHVCLSVYMHVHTVCMCLYINMCIWLRVAAAMDPFGEIQTHSWDPNQVTGDPDPIWIRIRCGSDTLAIRKPTNGIIWRFIPVRAVETRWRFGSKIASFHVSFCLCLIFLFTVVTRYLYFSLIISCDYLMIYQCDYLYHFMRH